MRPRTVGCVQGTDGTFLIERTSVKCIDLPNKVTESGRGREGSFGGVERDGIVWR